MENSSSSIFKKSKVSILIFIEALIKIFLPNKNIFRNINKDEQAEKFLENILLLLFPRFIVLLPFGGLIFGIITSGSIKDNPAFGFLWLILCIFISLVLLKITLNRREWSVKIEEKIKTYYKKDGLFSKNIENIVVNIDLFLFSAFTIPVVNTVSGWKSVGIWMTFLIIFVINLTFFVWSSRKIEGSLPPQNFSPIVLMILNFIAALIFLRSPPLFLSDFLGAISIAAISLSAITVVFSTIYNWGRPLSIRAVSAILVLAFIYSQFNWNDNHQIRYLKSNFNVVNSPINTSLEFNFKEWFTHRSDLDNFRKKGEYPVYIVSAQGGGIYAAYHAATTLAKLHDTIPNFSEHVFAISSVSGGSIGSSIYSSLIKVNSDSQEKIQSYEKTDCQSLPLCLKVHQVLDRDFLSPLLSFGLFPDLLQRLIPIPINDWDRARGLEIALENSWNKNIKTEKNPLARPYSEFWKPSGRAPALVLNTTIVETGERFIFSPFQIPSSTSKTILDDNLKIKDANLIPLSTAATLSARFPLVTPAGWVNYTYEKQNYKMRLVDGGYYDNSGLVTARDIVNALSDKKSIAEQSVIGVLEKDYKIKIKLINLAIVDSPQAENFVNVKGQGLNEILSPIKTVLKVRETRANSVIGQAAYDLNQVSNTFKNNEFRAFFLEKQRKKEQKNLPLGWLLSKDSQDFIDSQSPSYKECKTDNVTRFISELTEKINVNENNSCVAKLILKDLDN